MIKVLIKCSSRYPIERPRIRLLIKKILGDQGENKDIEVSLAFVGDRKMKELNKKYRQLEETTDVLSFSLEKDNFPDKVLRLGDIVISYPQARKQAGENNLTVDQEIDRLVEHGLLSLLGLHKS